MYELCRHYDMAYVPAGTIFPSCPAAFQLQTANLSRRQSKVFSTVAGQSVKYIQRDGGDRGCRKCADDLPLQHKASSPIPRSCQPNRK